MNNLAKVIGLGGRRLNKALAMHYLFSEQGKPKYIEFNGTQYVALDLPFTKDTVCRIKFNMTIVTGNCIMGSSPAFRFFNAAGRAYLDWGRGSAFGGDRINGGSIPAEQTFYIEFGDNYVKNMDTGNTIISGNEYGDIIRYDNNPICIMGNPYQKCAQGIVYLAEIIQNGETVRSLLPDIGAAGELGFCDTITGKFYSVIDTATASTMSLRMTEEEVTEDDTV